MNCRHLLTRDIRITLLENIPGSLELPHVLPVLHLVLKVFRLRLMVTINYHDFSHARKILGWRLVGDDFSLLRKAQR